jgi:acetyl-CoA acyltransferase
MASLISTASCITNAVLGPVLDGRAQCRKIRAGYGPPVTQSFLYAACRTPFGRFGGALAEVRPDDLAATALTGVLAQVGDLDPQLIGDVIWGCASQAGEDNRNVGRMAALLAGLPTSVPATTVNRLCGSSLDAAIAASRTVEAGDADVVVAGGVESMTRAPWVLPKPSRAFPAGNVTAVSTALGWRLVNDRMPAEWTVSLGEANELLADRLGISRERQDEFAARSHVLADQAWAGGFYGDLVVPVPGVDIPRDEGIRPGSTPEALAGLRPVFRPDGTITAGNASPLNDGASALVLGSEAASDLLGRAPLARVAGRGVSALDPQDFGIAPVEAANKALIRAGIRWDDVAAVELNEAFAVQSLACIDAWGNRPGQRQRPRRCHCHRPPARRLRRARPRDARQATRGGRRPLGSRGDLHRRRPGPHRRAGEPGGDGVSLTAICESAAQAVEPSRTAAGAPARWSAGHGAEALTVLTGELGDVVEVRVEVKDGQPRELGGGRVEEVRDRRGAAVAPLREQQLHLECPVLDRGREVLDGHDRDRRAAEHRAGLGCGPRRVADFEPGDAGDPHQASFDACGPLLGIGAVGQTYQGGLVDQPFGHRHAALVTSSSARSANVSAKSRRSCTETGALTVAASAARRLRMYSTREIPSRAA